MTIQRHRIADWNEYLSNTGWDPNSPTSQPLLFVDALYDDLEPQTNDPAMPPLLPSPKE